MIPAGSMTPPAPDHPTADAPRPTPVGRTPRGATIAIVLCAGQGSRMGGQRNKVLLPLGDRPLLIHALATFERASRIDEMLLVAHPREVDICRTLAATYGLRKVRAVIPGGATRHQSEWCALTYLRPRILAGTVEIVLIHDGARPFITLRALAQLIQVARAAGGAVLATPLDARDVVVEADTHQHVSRVFPSTALWRAQTPQAFDARILLRAYEHAARDGFEGTDTAASVERAGGSVRIVASSPRNIKITTPGDLARAAALLRTRSRAAARTPRTLDATAASVPPVPPGHPAGAR